MPETILKKSIYPRAFAQTVSGLLFVLAVCPSSATAQNGSAYFHPAISS